MKKNLFLFFLPFLMFYETDAQGNPCDPQCNITFNEIFSLRCPSASVVGSLNGLTISFVSFQPDTIVLGGPNCGDKAAALLKKFRDEDERNELFLKKRCCSALEGWVPTGDCVHGGPPPCCTAPESTRPWKKTNPAQAMQSWKAEQEKVYQQRLKELVNLIKPCKIHTINTTSETVDNSYRVAIEMMNTYKEIDPTQAAAFENTHGTKIKQLRQQFQNEKNKGDKADIEKLHQYADEMEAEKSSLVQMKDHIVAVKRDRDQAVQVEKEKTENENIARENARKQATENARIQDSLNRSATDMRVAATNSAVAASNSAMAASAIGVIGLASGLKDEYSDGPVFGKFYLGLGWDQIPLIASDFYHKTSGTEVTSHPVIAAGLKFAFFNNKAVSLHINPFASYGLNAVLPGTTGSHLSYGGNATLFLSMKAESKLRLFGEGGYTKRSGDWTYDQDAAASSIMTTYTNVVKFGDYDYSLLRYGGGVMLHFIDDDEESYLKTGIFLEKPSFLKNSNRNSMVVDLQLFISSFALLDFSYSKNYLISGSVNYPSSFNKSNQDFFSIRFVKSGKLF